MIQSTLLLMTIQMEISSFTQVIVSTLSVSKDSTLIIEFALVVQLSLVAMHVQAHQRALPVFKVSISVAVHVLAVSSYPIAEAVNRIVNVRSAGKAMRWIIQIITALCVRV